MILNDSIRILNEDLFLNKAGTVCTIVTSCVAEMTTMEHHIKKNLYFTKILLLSTELILVISLNKSMQQIIRSD